MNDPLKDLTGGLLSGAGVSLRSLTINGVTYIQEGGDLRPATEAEIAALEERKAAKAAAKAARQQEKRTGGPDISIGDVAGGDIIRKG